MCELSVTNGGGEGITGVSYTGPVILYYRNGLKTFSFIYMDGRGILEYGKLSTKEMK